MRVIGFCVAMAALLLSFSASAHWQYTRWGMTEAQVIKASKGAAVSASDTDADKHKAYGDNANINLTAPYKAGEFEFNAYFGFKDGKLANVQLDLTSGDVHKLIGALRNKYGKPASEPTADDSGFDMWLWHTSDDLVQLAAVGGYVTLSYYTKHDKTEKGL
jgi:hypothetical protein